MSETLDDLLGFDLSAEWRELAACRDVDAEVMFPLNGDEDQSRWTPLVRARVNDAKRVCRSCPVVLTCAQWALETGQPAGVWGALSTSERRVLRRARGFSDPADPDG